jgi:carotenoid cleavage dioxygenase-like enzyme
MQIRIDPDTLHSLGVFHFDRSPGNRMTTAHPHLDTYDAYNLVVQYGPVNYYKIYGFKNKVTELFSMPVQEPAYMHSFGMSKNYFIISEYPLVVQSLKLALRFRPFIENFKWKPSKGTRFYIIDRRSGKLAFKVVSESFFSFHHINAYEENEKLVVDMVNYPDSKIIDEYYIHRMESGSNELPSGRIERFTFDLISKNLLNRKILSETTIELPNIHYNSAHGNSEYRYVYGCGINPERRKEFYNQIVKIELNTGKTISWYCDNCYPGEPVFIPHPDRKSEDHGVLLSVVLNAFSSNSFLLILDAEDLSEIARAELPHAILFGYHGLFNAN